MKRSKNSIQKVTEASLTNETTTTRKRRPGRTRNRVLLGLLCVLIAASSVVGLAWWTSRYADRINMGTACNDGTMQNTGNMGNMQNMCQGNTAITPITSLQAPQTAEHIKTFTLTARASQLSLGEAGHVDAWTFDGTSPGPTLHVRQGDLVIVHLVNHLTFGVTIHWHGVAVPNSADGVAGLTQNAVKPGQTYTYRFVAKDAGTYWYHSHQESFEETSHGLFGLLVVQPATPLTHDDVDETLALHSWNGVPTINAIAGTSHVTAQPGQWVRLRIVNTDNYPYQLTLVGSPFMVAALDGHYLNQPTLLRATPFSIDAAQRYDLRFRMPQSGSVALLVAKDGEQQYLKNLHVLVGQGSLSSLTVPQVSRNWFDFTIYGQPQPDAITVRSHFDVSYDISLGFTFGFSNGRPGPVFTLNGRSFPDTPTIVVKPGQLVKLHFVNNADSGIHPMHLHGHTFTVLAKNGRPLTGSPVHLDTISVHPHESYDVAFYADNPGLWMLHCHNLYHANHGMDMMIVYPNISTPYSIGNASGNFPD
jgi:FtsP/CotA-like multicopper oxidase with cupredoxin domain